MITLYASSTPNVLKIYLALEELGLAYVVQPVDVLAGETFSPAFLAINPNGKVPVIVDHADVAAAPVRVFESGAILIYLAERTGRLLAADPVERAEALAWLMVQKSGLGPLFGQYVHFLFYAHERNDYALSRYATLVHRILGTLDQRLMAAEWIGGRDYGIADMAFFPWLRQLDAVFGAGATAEYPAIARWIEVIAGRAATLRSIAAIEDLGRLTTSPHEASSDAMDRFFGRGSYARSGEQPVVYIQQA